MPTITVQCDNCQVSHDATRFNAGDKVRDCNWCGSDICHNCDQTEGLHTDCWERRKKDDEEDRRMEEEDNG